MPSIDIKSEAPAGDKATVPAGATATVTTDPNGSSTATVPMVPKVEEKPAEKLFAGKYKTVEEFEKGYKELESKLGAPKAPDITPEAAKTAGLDLNALSKEFGEKGKFSDESRTKLKAAGFDDAGIDGWAAGQKAVQEKQVADIASSVGGQEALTKVLEWAKTGLTESEKKGYNDALAGGNIDAAKLLLAGITNKYVAKVGKDPHLVTGEPSGTGNEPGFASASEMTAAMRDPRYAKDPAYRKTVETRVKNAKY